jgi:hypothetical protein
MLCLPARARGSHQGDREITLTSCFAPLNQHLRFVFLDLIWRCLWCVCISLASVAFGLTIIAKLDTLEWKGPELGAADPIMLITALRKFWGAYGGILISQLALLVAGAFILWLVLEALFRGGRRAFWVYLGTAAGRLALLAGAAALFTILSAMDETRGTFLIGAVVLLGLWLMVSILETAIRKDALAVIGREFPRLVAVFGALLFAEMFLAFVLWGSAIAALKSMANSGIGVAALAIVVVAAPFWMVVHSYLIALRFSAIDIMRNAVGE